MTQKLLTVRDVAQILDVSEQELIELAEQGAIPAYKIAGTHLRFRKEQINHIRQLEHIKFKSKVKHIKYSSAERIADFIYFNDFYIVSFMLVIVMLWLIFK
ncbi:MAG: helix-turn-helix domain-containing protein [Candidatus Omnitrophota bacterium]